MPGDAGSLLNHLFDKWKLGPLRMLNLFAMLVLIMHFGPRLSERLPRIGFLEKLGSASLPVFCMHLVVVLAALSIAGQYQPGRPLLLDLLMMSAGLAALYATALITLYIDREERQRMLAARAEQELQRSRRGGTSAANAAKPDLPT